MPERESDSGGIVSRDEIADLAALFDAFEFALDPLLASVREAQAQFEQQVAAPYDTRVHSRFPSLTLRDFRAGLRYQCRTLPQREKAAQRRPF